jgi:bromodomain and PHD finger-containing protein 1
VQPCPLVETGDEADALCAVCGGGESEEPNEIVFCERCEVAVHQDCYGVEDVPEGDWLCWPCHAAGLYKLFPVYP